MIDTTIKALVLGKQKTQPNTIWGGQERYCGKNKSLPGKGNAAYKGISLYLLLYIKGDIHLVNHREFRTVCI